jgi:hypothetical protein
MLMQIEGQLLAYCFLVLGLTQANSIFLQLTESHSGFLDGLSSRLNFVFFLLDLHLALLLHRFLELAWQFSYLLSLTLVFLSHSLHWLSHSEPFLPRLTDFLSNFLADLLIEFTNFLYRWNTTFLQSSFSFRERYLTAIIRSYFCFASCKVRLCRFC